MTVWHFVLGAIAVAVIVLLLWPWEPIGSKPPKN